MNSRTRINVWLTKATVGAAATLFGTIALAQVVPGAAATVTVVGAGSAETAAGPLNLRQIFDAAWTRQPEALALQARREAAGAQRNAAKSWTPQPAALELSNKTDRLGSRP